jgi:cytoskeletal protein RodZ
MPTLGEELRQKREQRGVTLAEISEATRIGTRFLKAIETDSFSILPGGIFTRSFIRAYAKYVGMNEDEAIDTNSGCRPTARQKRTVSSPFRAGRVPAGSFTNKLADNRHRRRHRRLRCVDRAGGG